MNDKSKSLRLEEAELKIIEVLKDHKILEGSTPSAGIQAYNDRVLIERLMPKLDKFLNFM